MATATDSAAAAARARLNDDVARVAGGDHAALRRVYDATSSKLFGICLRLTGDREAAEDALQEVYLRVWRRAARFDAARASAITWLCLIARGVAIDARRVSSRGSRDQEVIAAHVASEADMVPVDAVHGDRRDIEECLDQLDDGQSQYIRSAYFDGYSYADLAHQAEIPVPTMKSRIRRGLLALRRCLDDSE